MSKKTVGFILLMLMLALASLFSMGRLQSTIPVSAGQIAYVQTPDSGSYPVGSKSVSATAPNPSGDCELERPDSPGSGGASCWSSTVGFDGVSKTLRISEGHLLHPYLEVWYEAAGGRLPKDWSNTFSLRFRKGFFNYSFASDNTRLVRLGADNSVKLSLDNRLITIDGGFIITKTTEKLASEKKSYLSQTFFLGRKDYVVASDSSVLGLNCIEVLPYAEVGLSRQKVFPTEPQRFCYNVVPNIEEFVDTSTRCISSSECKAGFSCQKVLPSSEATLCVKGVGRSAVEPKSSVLSAFSFSGVKLVILLVLLAGLGAAVFLAFRGAKIGKR